ncbi:MAG: universal stress protein [bacterium]
MKILAATSGSAPAKKRADYIISTADKLKAELVVLHVINKQDDYADGEKALDIFRFKNRGGFIKTIFRIGNITDTIANTAEEEGADFIIIGIEGGLDSLNNICKGISRLTSIPVLLIPDI